MKKRMELTREERLEAKLDRLRDPLVPTRGPVKPRKMRTPDDQPRWDYSADRQGDEG